MCSSQDSPEATHPENCRFDACFNFKGLIDDSICESELNGGKHFIYKVKHTAGDIQKAYTDIFPSLINGYEIDNKPKLEKYTVDMVKNHYCEICIPIKQ
nr:GyrI-like domain-containing protein [Oceanobacillus zhaokaii]